MTDAPHQTWWSAAEIAEARLPDLPATARAVQLLAKRAGWDAAPGKQRRRSGRGGGREYHFSLFPSRARLALIQQAQAAPEAPAPRPREAVWAAFDALKAPAKAKAEARLKAVAQIEAFESAGLTRSAAVVQVAGLEGVSEKTLWNWLGLIEGVTVEDRLAYLAPRHAGPKGKKKAVDPRFYRYFKSDYLRDKAITFRVAWEHAVKFAKREGIKDIPPVHLCRRRFKDEVPEPVVVLCREGPHALKRFYPHQERSRSAMRAMEAVQADYHKLDVFVDWPGEEKPQRPQIVVFSDIYSGKLLAWRMSLNPNAETVRLCFGDVVRKFGLPSHALMDNGREFAAKILTGGAATRYRFKANDDDMLGLFPVLGIELHWASPGWGQAKPVERAFLDLTRRIPTDPRLHGAQAGNDPRNKPKEWGKKPADPETLLAVVREVIDAHNARPDRRTETAWNKSFNDVFNASYKTAPVKMPTEEQTRLWLMAAEPAMAKRGNGELKLYGNRYWSEWMYQVAGQKVVARFDPDDLHQPLHVYTLTGEYLGEAKLVEKGYFFSKEAAQDHTRKRNQFIKATRDAERLHKELSDREIAAQLGDPGAHVTPDALPQAEVVQLVPAHPKAPKPARQRRDAEEQAVEARLEARIAQLADHRPDPAIDADDPEARFERYLELKGMQDEGRPLTDEQRAFVEDYPTTPQCRSFARMRAAFGNNNND